MNSPLKQARLKLKLTLQQVANAVGIDTGNLSRIERGLQVPSKELAERLVKFFDNEVTETQIIYPERFSEPPDTPSAQYTGPERRIGMEPPHLMPKRRKTNGV